MVSEARLLVSLILVRAADVSLVVGGIWKYVERFPIFLDHRYLARRKLLELLLLRSILRRDCFEASGDQHALFVFHGGLRRGATNHECQQRYGGAGLE